MENKQTAVEWLMSKLSLRDNCPFQAIAFYQDNKEFIEQAKAMEKGQIMDAYCEGVNDLDNIEEGSNIDWVGYYNKTYEKA